MLSERMLDFTGSGIPLGVVMRTVRSLDFTSCGSWGVWHTMDRENF
jgi:hypothetical protein